MPPESGASLYLQPSLPLTLSLTPQALSTLTFFLLLEQTKLSPTSGSEHMLCPVPVTPFPDFSDGWPILIIYDSFQMLPLQRLFLAK